MGVGVSDNPVTADELGRRRPEVGDGDGVGKHKTITRLIGLLRQVIHLSLYGDTMLIDFFHARHLNRFSLMSQGFRSVFMITFVRIYWIYRGVDERIFETHPECKGV
jgi:hypothetical protein